MTPWWPFKNRFRSKEPPFDYEKAVGKLMLETHRLTANVVIVTSTYGEEAFRGCDIVADTKALVPWLGRHSKGRFLESHEYQAALLALPLLLQSANLDDKAWSCLPASCYHAIRDQARQLVTEGIAKVYCHTCQSFTDPVEGKENNHGAVGWGWWTDVWTCPCGANLLHEECEMRIARFYSGKKNDGDDAEDDRCVIPEFLHKPK